MKPGKVRTKARTAAKKKERDLIARAKKLRDGPDPLIPECGGDCAKCPFDKMKAKLLKLLRYKDNPKKLNGLANRGTGFSKAYAATLLLASQDKAPYLAVARVGNKDIAYAQRGKAKKEMLIGFQHYHDPDARLLAVADIARRYGLYVFSVKDRMICTGTSGKPPEEYVRESIARTGYTFQKTAEGYASVDPNDDTVLSVKWIPADLVLSVSRQRSSTKRNLTSVILNRMVHPKADVVFEIRVQPGFQHANGDEDCPLNRLTKVSDHWRAEYVGGRTSDRELIDNHVEDVRDKAEKMSRRIFAVGMSCFDDDTDAFIESLRPSDVEREALEALLDNLDENIIVDEATPAKVLDMFWKETGMEVLEAVLGDEEVAEEFYKRSLKSDEVPTQVLQEAFQSARRERILADLPDYKRLPPVARFCDRIARIHRTKGSDAAAREIRKNQSRKKEFKALEYALLLALGAGKGEEWRYTEDERGFGAHLKSKAGALLSAEPEGYDASLRSLMTASGHAF